MPQVTKSTALRVSKQPAPRVSEPAALRVPELRYLADWKLRGVVQKNCRRLVHRNRWAIRASGIARRVEIAGISCIEAAGVPFIEIASDTEIVGALSIE